MSPEPSSPPNSGSRAGESDFGNYFVATYPPFSSWTRERIPALQQRLAQAPAAAAPMLGLYLHVPFCEHRCRFCYYLSHDDRAAAIDPYLEALAKELSLLGRTPYLAERGLGFVYVGGGTPSLLSVARLGRLLDSMQSLFSWDDALEVTVECAPRTTTREKLRLLRERGVTRLSLGVQHLDDEVLERSGRVHLVADAERAWADVERTEFPVTNVDLIVGLPGETDDSLARTLERVIQWSPASITLYQLEIPLNTPLYRLLHGDLGDPRDPRDPAGAGDPSPAGWPTKRARLGRAFERLQADGYTVATAYAAVRDPVRHRFVYQDEQYRGADLLGVGVASFSYLGGIHHQNETALDAYVRHLDEGRLPWGRAYSLSEDERLVRELVLQLKLGGCSLRELQEKFGVDPRQRFAEPFARLARSDLARIEDDAIRLTRAGLLRADELLPAFYLPAHRGVRYS